MEMARRRDSEVVVGEFGGEQAIVDLRTWSVAAQMSRDATTGRDRAGHTRNFAMAKNGFLGTQTYPHDLGRFIFGPGGVLGF
jgi:hypothetical protein